MASEKKDDSTQSAGTDPSLPEPPAIHPSFIQVAKPYIFEQTIQKCIAAMGVNPLREEALRLQGVTWIDNVRRGLYLYVEKLELHSENHSKQELLLTRQAYSHLQHCCRLLS
jgi:CTD kinase subunit beta